MNLSNASGTDSYNQDSRKEGTRQGKRYTRAGAFLETGPGATAHHNPMQVGADFYPLSLSFPYIERRALQVRARVMQAQVSGARFDPWRALGTWNTLLHPFPGCPERPNG